MNCLILVLLLLCCGNGGNCQNDSTCRNKSSNDCGRRDMNDRDCGRRDMSDRDCGRRDMGDRDCGCRNDSRPESRLEPRSFISYPGSNCGCEEPRNNNGCDCAD